MKKFVLTGFLFVASICLAQSKSNVFQGEISDSQCAYNVHSQSQSHKEMTDSHTMGSSKEDCVQTCVKKMGGQYVLLTTKGKVYRLDDQSSPEPFAGKDVKVTGTLDARSKTIKVEKIEAAR